ncbi:FecCD family ABC transporter permease [Mongoliibacter ruber]|uniref:Iron complex transport system permease protein n=1 Tax=Mongoliibacter ruber TaxID=1750599 RepID=A0A2T0WD52_9BACT|nr:iron ABC transporter permease [Mongoliibacter ruber]PRY84639.1 iron complex transport system permease protein [Mongoliibacter ruber]
MSLQTLTYHKEKKQMKVLVSLSVLLLAVILIALSVGAFGIPMTSIFSMIADGMGISTGSYTQQELRVLTNIRLPRVLLAMLVGGGLGLSGAALQGLFRNPLVEPGLIGVSSGGALFAVIYIVFGASMPLMSSLGKIGLPLFAFLGGLINTFLVYKLASQSGKTDISLLILAGVALNALCGALIGLVIFYADDAALRNFTFWSLGDIGGANWQKVGISFCFLLIPVGMILSQFRSLNALAIGENEAFHMGVNVQLVKYILLFASALIVGTAVSLTGTIGFVGLIVPHLIRLLYGADHKLVLPGSFLLGAILLSVADILARTLMMPAELPIGIITAIIGAPFFIWLIINFKNIRR